MTMVLGCSGVQTTEPEIEHASIDVQYTPEGVAGTIELEASIPNVDIETGARIDIRDEIRVLDLCFQVTILNSITIPVSLECDLSIPVCEVCITDNVCFQFGNTENTITE